MRRSPVVLFDVGCSGGIEPYWRHFGSHLTGVGFDALVDEVEYLNAAPGHGFRYEAALVGCKSYDELFSRALRDDPIASRDNASFERTSAVANARLKKLDYSREAYNRGRPAVYTDCRLDLDDYAAEHGYPKIDFLKTDTDDHDIEVLLGARALLRNGCLAAVVECNFRGRHHPAANSFANIDQLQRGAGFSLFDIEPYRYTKAALPGRFADEHPSHTVGGAVQWADAVFARDFADPDHERKTGYRPTADDVVKLAVFLDIFGLQDCAAELLQARRDLIAPVCDVDAALDRATRNAYGDRLTYARCVAAFEHDPDRMMPSRAAPPRARWSLSRLLGRS